MIKIEIKYKINDKDLNKSIEQILRNNLKFSKRLLIKLKKENKIYLNNNNIFTNYIVKIDDIILINLDFIESDNIVPKEMGLKILYEDEYLLAINKPSNMVVHPSANHFEDSLSNGVKHYLNNNRKIRILTRLDKDTSGIVLFAKNEYIQDLLAKENIKGNVYKEYLAIVDGIVSKNNDTINAPISRVDGSIIERKVSSTGKNAITHYEVINRKKDYTIIKIRLETGKTHQIRVHMSYIGNPVLGDTLYGKESILINRQALHASTLEFKHPILDKQIKIEADLYEDMKQLI